MKPFFSLPSCPFCGVQQTYRSVILSWIGKGQACRRCKKKMKYRFTIRTAILCVGLLIACFIINSFLLSQIDSLVPLLFITFFIGGNGFSFASFYGSLQEAKKIALFFL